MALIETKMDIDVQELAKTLDPKHQEISDSLRSASRASFDTQYIYAQVKVHAETLQLFREYNENGDNDSLKHFAATTIPTLQMHKQHIKGLAMSK